jgi:NAD(P)-dependent dehydrogenase (short-subunit alcohol dehydrogenase family)
MTDLTGKTVLITGASRGIGAEAARVFAEAGANVALVARSSDSIADIAGEIGQKAVAIPCDISRYWEVAQAVENCVSAFGGLDILINNAGVIEPIARMTEADPKDWGQVIDINLKGVFHGMHAALPVMQRAGGGTILTISSGAAHNPVEAWSHYCASKAGAAMLTMCLHKEMGDKGIRAPSPPRCSARSRPAASTRSASWTGRIISRRIGRQRRCCGCAARMRMYIWAKRSHCGTKPFAKRLGLYDRCLQ